MVTPYLVFNGNCKEVLNFYKKVFEIEEIKSMPYGDYVPEGVETPPSDLGTWILHAEAKICGANFWFADEIETLTNGNVVRLSALVPNKKDAQKIFDRLKENGIISLPPTETFYSSFHAALIDKFGINWNIIAEEAPNAQ